jgi:glycosyltransferase domain-containing protein
MTAAALADCTIIIPTHERAAYLRRAVAWFEGFGCPIIIADSSAEPSLAPSPGSRQVLLHMPGGFEVYIAKLAAAAEQVRTPFVALCADDDFILREGLLRSIAFLADNEGHVFAQGFSYLYQVLGQRLATWPMPYHTHEVPHEDWRDRVEAATSTVFYGVQRAEVLRRSLAFLAGAGLAPLKADAIGLIDFTMTKIAARAGRFRRLDVPFAMREYSPAVSGVGFRFRTIVSPIIPAFYAALLDELAGPEAGEPETRLRLLRLFGADYAGQITYDLAIGTAPQRRLGRLPRFIRDDPARLALVEYLYRRVQARRLFASAPYRGQEMVFGCEDFRRVRAVLLPGREGG